MRLVPVRLLAAVVLTLALIGITAERPPDIVLIVIDALRADHLGCYGYTRDTSPTLDVLARRGTRYARACAASSWTGATVASILTGEYPAVHHVETGTSVLGDDHPTIAEALRARGYRTAAFSANPLFVTPEMGFAHGFDRFEVLHGPPADPRTDLDTIPLGTDRRTSVKVANAALVTNAAVKWLEMSPHDPAPFFLYLHYFDPHGGYFPPRRYAERFGVRSDAPLAGAAQWPVLLSFQAPAPADLAVLIALYDAEIAYTDAELGRLLDALRSRGGRRMLVVVTADHGEEFGDHGGLQHGLTLWQEQLHVPLIVSGPGAPRAVVAAPTSQTEISRIITRGAHPASQPIFAALEPHIPLVESRQRHRRAVLMGDRKLIVDRDGTSATYDLTTDPREAHALAPAADLTAYLAAYDAQRPRSTATGGSVTPELRERMRALGYVP